jgi:hypothetical protein
MGARTPKTCPAGSWTYVDSIPSFTGLLLVFKSGFDQVVSYRIVSASLPSYFQNTITFSASTALLIGPTPLASLWVNPSLTAGFSLADPPL